MWVYIRTEILACFSFMSVDFLSGVRRRLCSDFVHASNLPTRRSKPNFHHYIGLSDVITLNLYVAIRIKGIPFLMGSACSSLSGLG